MTAAVATRDEKPTIESYIASLRPELQRALPRGMDADRIARIALTVVRVSEREFRKGNSNASLMQCSPESFAGALLTSSALGLEPGVNGECYLVPYKNECTLIIGYQGYAKLFYQHPLARNIDTRAVHEGDDFDFGYGTAPFLSHKPVIGDAGPVVAYYAVASLSTGASAFVVLSPDEVKALRGGKIGPSGKIKDPQRWMERKTALRQLVKLLPRSANLSAAVVVDEQTGTVLASHDAARAITDGGAPEIEPAQTEPEPQPERVTAAEIRGEQPRAARMISGPQRGKMHALYGELGITDKAKRLADTSGVVGRDVTTSNDLSADEARVLIDDLERRVQDTMQSGDGELFPGAS